MTYPVRIIPQPYQPSHLLSPLQQALDAAAFAEQAHGSILRWHQHPLTGEFTGFEVVAWQEDAQE